MIRVAFGLALAAGAVPGRAAAAPDAATSAAPAPVVDQPSDSPPAELVVTARRRPEDPQKIPLSLTIVDGALLDSSYTINTQGLTVLVPTLNYSSANPRNTAFTIRGLGSSVVAVSQANDGLEPGVGFYVDQVYHARPATAAFDFTDLDQVEVLRGPQGTLFGKNSTAGTINITTRLPRFVFEANEELLAGSNGYVQAKGSVTGPITGTLAARFSGLLTRRDGVIRNVRNGLRNGRNQNSISNEALRGQLLFKPREDVQVRLIADWSNFAGECCVQVPVRVAPTLRPAARQYAALAAGVGYAPPSFDPYDRLTDIDADLGVDTNEGGVSAIADWKLGGANLTSVTAWRFWNWDAANDRDYTALPIQTTQHIPSRQDQYSQELRVASDGERRFHYVGGVYFFRQRIIGRPITIYGPLATYWLLGPAPQFPANLLDGYGTDGRTDFRSDSYAAFGEVNWRVIDRLTLTGGLRYTYEEKTVDYATTVSGGFQGVSAALRNSQLSILRPQSYQGAVKDGALTGRANAAYDFTDNVLGYVSYARGAKSGGLNASGLPLNAANQPALATVVIRPETNSSYEIGLKSRLFDRRVVFNINAYRSDVTDFQANVVDTGPGALRGYLANVPRVRVQGVEVDASASITRHVSVRGAAAYTDGRYVSYPNGPCPIEQIANATTVCNLSGNPLPSLPKWTVSLGADVTQSARLFGQSGEFFAHADSSSRTRTVDPSNSRFTVIDGYSVVNAAIGFRPRAGWEVGVYVRNLFAANFIQNYTVQAGNSGLIIGTPSDPRRFGVTLRLRQ